MRTDRPTGITTDIPKYTWGEAVSRMAPATLLNPRTDIDLRVVHCHSPQEVGAILGQVGSEFCRRRPEAQEVGICVVLWASADQTAYLAGISSDPFLCEDRVLSGQTSDAAAADLMSLIYKVLGRDTEAQPKEA